MLPLNSNPTSTSFTTQQLIAAGAYTIQQCALVVTAGTHKKFKTGLLWWGVSFTLSLSSLNSNSVAKSLNNITWNLSNQSPSARYPIGKCRSTFKQNESKMVTRFFPVKNTDQLQTTHCKRCLVVDLKSTSVKVGAAGKRPGEASVVTTWSE